MELMKLIPATKDYLWGGTKLKEEYGIKSDKEPVAEAWVLSCHPDGASVIANGEHRGKTLEQLRREHHELFGTNCRKFEFFPMLVKLIDAKKDLSVQVHPSDDYALKNEGQYGKTEMWYVVDCNEGAYLYYGFNKKITPEEFKKRIENNTICDVLNKVNVKKGDCFFIESGTIHAIGAGILIAEIQQNSNLTYRVYDYARVGADGKPRELHVEKAMKVTKLEKPTAHYGQPKGTLLGSCDYFTSELIEVNGSAEVTSTNESFVHLLCTDGSATVNGSELKKGDSMFIPAGFGKAYITGNAEIIASRV